MGDTADTNGLPPLDVPSDDGELTDSDEERARPPVVEEVPIVNEEVPTVEEVPIVNKAVPIPSEAATVTALPPPPALPTLAVDDEEAASSATPTETGEVTEPSPPPKKLTLLERLKQMKFGKPGAAKVDMYTPPSARMSAHRVKVAPIDVEAPSAPVTIGNRANRRQAAGGSSGRHDWDTPVEDGMIEENDFDDCVRQNRYRDDEMMEPRRMRGRRRYRQNRYHEDDMGMANGHYGNQYGYDDEPYERSSPPRMLTPPPRPATPPPLTFDDVSRMMDDLALDYDDLGRCDWSTCKQLVVMLRESGGKLLEELAEHETKIDEMQTKLQKERADLNLPPSRHIMMMSRNVEVPTLAPLIAANAVPSVFTAAAWNPSSSLAPPPNNPPSALPSFGFPPNIRNSFGPPPSTGPTLAQVLGVAPPPPAPLPTNTMSASTLVQSLTKMLAVPNMSAPPPPMPSQTMAANQISLTVAPQVNANIAKPDDAALAQTAPLNKRPTMQLTLRTGGVQRRAFKNKRSMLVGGGGSPGRKMHRGGGGNANMVPLAGRRGRTAQLTTPVATIDLEGEKDTIVDDQVVAVEGQADEQPLSHSIASMLGDDAPTSSDLN